MTETLTILNHIDGAWQDAADGRTAPIVNPATGEPLATMAVSSATDVDAAVTAAAQARPAWGATPPSERTAALFALAEACEAHIDELARLEALDAGKPITAARELEMPGIIDAIRVFAGAARALESMAPGEYVRDMTSILRREPIGVVAAITPWNYPLLQAVCKLAPALATGNTIVLKPAETTPVSIARLAELAQDVLPPGVFNLINGLGAGAGAALVSHPGVDMVSFTGSIAAGRRVGEAAGAQIKKAVMELGGNAPVIVFDDVELEPAVAAILEAGLYNTGQECMAASRVLVRKGLEDDFVSALADGARATRLGDTLDPGTVLGPLTSAVQRERVEGFLERRPRHAEIVTGGDRPDLPGFFLEPTIVTGLAQEDELVQQEIFGPVFTVQTFADEAEAIAMANGTSFGLAASVWTENLGRALRVSNALNFGTVWVNAHLSLAPELPVGGFGDSGHGYENGLMGLEEYTRIKHVGINHALHRS
jgi:betaine-aldehyde dehydrogenase